MINNIMTDKIKILCVVGTRPNFIKIAPLISAFRKSGKIEPTLVHTGQHYDNNMSDAFFHDLDIPKPDVNLYIKGAEPHIQSIQIIARFNYVIDLFEPDYVLVVGDVTSSFACAYTAYYNHIPIIHIESGQRSYDNTMPEEINRVAIDRMSTLLFVSKQSGYENLIDEGYNDKHIYNCGNILNDSISMVKSDTNILNYLGLTHNNYNLLTLHRDTNVDNIDKLKSIIIEIEKIASDKPVVFPVHPRTQKTLLNITTTNNIIKTEPMCYTDFITLVKHSNVVITDSGGIQEEALLLGVPCLTLRYNTERHLTVALGSNELIGTDRLTIEKSIKRTLSEDVKSYQPPEKWDTKVASRIIKVIDDNPSLLNISHPVGF